jgi:hypothetical protein
MNRVHAVPKMLRVKNAVVPTPLLENAVYKKVTSFPALVVVVIPVHVTSLEPAVFRVRVIRQT